MDKENSDVNDYEEENLLEEIAENVSSQYV